VGRFVYIKQPTAIRTLEIKLMIQIVIEGKRFGKMNVAPPREAITIRPRLSAPIKA
jgi:hypothetical protein